MPITVSCHMDEEMLVKLMDYFIAKQKILIPRRGTILVNIVAAYYNDLLRRGEISKEPLPLPYMEQRLAATTFKSKSAGQMHVSQGKIRERQRGAEVDVAAPSDELLDEILKDFSND